jgi:hypothetical protein
MGEWWYGTTHFQPLHEIEMEQNLIKVKILRLPFRHHAGFWDKQTER